jgi:hypothetical protein
VAPAVLETALWLRDQIDAKPLAVRFRFWVDFLGLPRLRPLPRERFGAGILADDAIEDASAELARRIADRLDRLPDEDADRMRETFREIRTTELPPGLAGWFLGLTERTIEAAIEDLERGLAELRDRLTAVRVSGPR